MTRGSVVAVLFVFGVVIGFAAGMFATPTKTVTQTAYVDKVPADCVALEKWESGFILQVLKAYNDTTDYITFGHEFESIVVANDAVFNTLNLQACQMPSGTSS